MMTISHCFVVRLALSLPDISVLFQVPRTWILGHVLETVHAESGKKKYKNQNPQQDKAAKKMASLIENMSSWMLTAIKQRTFGAGHALKDLLFFFGYVAARND